MKWIGKQTIYDHVKFASGINIDSIDIDRIQSSSESFANNDTTLMTSAAIEDKILSYGYSTATGDITGVTAGTNLSGGGTTGTVTINLADASTSAKGAASFSSGNFTVSSGAVSIKTGGIDEDHINTGVVTIEKIAGTTIVTESERIGSNDNDDTIPTCAAVNDHIANTVSMASLATVGTIGTGVWEGTAIATAYTKHIIHYRFMGYSVGDGTNYEMPQPLTDGQAPFEHADSSSADGLTIPAGSGTNVSEMIRMGGHVMPRAGTLKKWKGWASYNKSGGSCFVSLFKWSPVQNDDTNISASHGGLTLLDTATVDGKSNDKVMPIDETTFTSASVAEGDIIFTQVKTDTNNKTVYFNTTLEIEF